jgi:AcrR family transcriptional regulator
MPPFRKVSEVRGFVVAGSQVAQPADEAVPDRPKRADARRNYDVLLAAATEVFAERGVEASLEEIARRANVGIGTLYRHFPSRDALNEAVYRHEVELLCTGVDELLEQHPPDEALSIWMNRFSGYVARKRGMAVALKSALGADNELFTHSRRRILDALGMLVEAAAAAGVIRADVDPDDLLRAMSGICMATDTPSGSERTGRLVDLLVDGLRYRASSASSASGPVSSAPFPG